MEEPRGYDDGSRLGNFEPYEWEEGEREEGKPVRYVPGRRVRDRGRGRLGRMTNFNLRRPCGDCPFRDDKPFYLGESRREEIVESITTGDQSFQCHQTTHHDGEHFDDEGYYHAEGDEEHCAGAMTLLEKNGRANQMMRIAERIGLYDRSALDMEAPVYDMPEEFVTGDGSEI